jgi:hypothetical protein
MSITAFTGWSATAASNVDLNGIPLSDSMLANQIDDAIREMMAQLASAGFITTASATIADNVFRIKGSSDATKLVAFEVDGLTTGTTRTVTIPDASGTVAYLASPTFTGTPAAPTAAAGTNTTQIATTAFVTAATGGGTPFAVGSYAMCKYTGAGTLAAGATTSGANLTPGFVWFDSSGFYKFTPGSSPSGTWKNMSGAQLYNDGYELGPALFQRIS